jgi:hypothetical protein
MSEWTIAALLGIAFIAGVAVGIFIPFLWRRYINDGYRWL